MIFAVLLACIAGIGCLGILLGVLHFFIGGTIGSNVTFCILVSVWMFLYLGATDKNAALFLLGVVGFVYLFLFFTIHKPPRSGADSEHIFTSLRGKK